MVGVEGEHSKPLVPVEKGIEMAFILCPQSDGMQKLVVVGSVCNKMRENL